MTDSRLKRRVRDELPTDALALCTCAHPLYVHNANGNCDRCQVNPRTNKSRCRRFKADAK